MDGARYRAEQYPSLKVWRVIDLLSGEVVCEAFTERNADRVVAALVLADVVESNLTRSA